MTDQDGVMAPHEFEQAARPTPRWRPTKTARLVLGVVELVLAGTSVWLAFQLWPLGVVTIRTVLDDGLTLVSTRYHGNWMALSIVAGTVAALLVVDACRHVVSAIRGN